jgi:hypothetical protein
MTQNFLFPNLFAAIKAEKESELQKFISSFNDDDMPKTIEGLLKSWYYTDLLTSTTKRKKWAAFEELKAYLIARKTKAIATSIDKELTRLRTVSNAPELVSIVFNVEWKKSKMWGSNPNCEAKEETAENRLNYYNSGSIGGCGYDKESTAIANAANQSNSFLKALYLIKEQQPTIKNHDLFGYGSGYGILPQLEGGVGVSCYPIIFKKIGFTWKNIGSGKWFDVYVASKA